LGSMRGDQEGIGALAERGDVDGLVARLADPEWRVRRATVEGIVDAVRRAAPRTLDAIVFLAVLFPLISRFGLPGVAWAGVIAYGFACVNRIVALNKIIPGISAKLLRTLIGTAFVLVMLLLVRALISR